MNDRTLQVLMGGVGANDRTLQVLIGGDRTNYKTLQVLNGGGCFKISQTVIIYMEKRVPVNIFMYFY